MITYVLALALVVCGLDPIPWLEPDPGPDPEPVIVEELPIFLSVYDNRLGGRHCDSDCSTIAAGPIEPWMRGAIVGCWQDRYGGRLEVPGIGSWQILETGGALGVREVGGQLALVCDVLVDLVDEPAPDWAGSFVWDWVIVYE